MRAAISSLAVSGVLLAAAVPGLAEPLALAEPVPAEKNGLEMKPQLALGIIEHRLDHATELTGWRLNHSWYLGHRDGEGANAMSLIWQGERRQLSISTEEIRFTRRF